MLPHNASTVQEWVEEELLAAPAWGWMGRWLKREKGNVSMIKWIYFYAGGEVIHRNNDSAEASTGHSDYVRALNCD